MGFSCPLILFTIVTLCSLALCFDIDGSQDQNQQKDETSWEENELEVVNERAPQWSPGLEREPVAEGKEEPPSETVSRVLRYALDPPGRPGSIKASPVDSKNINVSWTEPEERKDAVGFYLLEWTWDGNRHGSHSPDGRERSYTLSRLVPYKEYSLSLKACLEIDDKALCGQSVTTSARTHSAAPGELTVTVNTTKYSILVEWQEPTIKNGPLDEYKVYITESVEGIEQTNTSKTRNTSWEQPNLQPGTNYTVAVQACNIDTVDNETPLCGSKATLIARTLDEIPSKDDKTTDDQTQNGSSKIVWIVVGVCAGLALVAGGAAALWFFKMRPRSKSTRRTEAEPSNRARSLKEIEVGKESSVNML